MPRHILHVITNLEIGGAETMLARVVTGLDPAHYRFTVAGLFGLGPLAPRIEAAGVPLVEIGLRRRQPWGGLRRLRTLIREQKPDMIMSWLYNADLATTLALAGLPQQQRPPLVWNLRCSYMETAAYGLHARLVRGALARLSRRPALVVSNSRAGQTIHAGLGYRPHGWALIPNGFEIERFRPDPEARAAFRRECGLGPDIRLVGLPARLDPQKDQATFLAAAARLAPRLAARRQEVAFVLAGRGLEPDSRPAQAMIAAAGLDPARVHLLGPRQDMPRVYAGLDLVALSSAFGEGFPNVLGEAMACGVPCVATDIGDSRDILADCGRIVPPRDPDALAAALEDLLALSPEALAALGRAARLRVEESFSLSTVLQHYGDLFDRLCST